MTARIEAAGTVSAPAFDLRRHLPQALLPVARLMPELSYYTIVSAVALGVDLAAFSVLTREGMRAAVAGLIGYSIGLVLHYGLSLRFVFDTSASAKSGARRFVEFVVSGLVGLGLTWAVVGASTEMLHLPAMAGKIAAVGSSFVIVFLLRRGIVFAADRR